MALRGNDLGHRDGGGAAADGRTALPTPENEQNRPFRGMERECRDDVAVCDAIDEAVQGEPGRPPKETVDNINGSVRPDGTSRDRALRQHRPGRRGRAS